MDSETRRQLLRLAGAAAAFGLAGCSGLPGGDGDTTKTTTYQPVPEEYKTAQSQGGSFRRPENLVPKSELNYQPNPRNGRQCADCQYYIQDKNGDGMGACTVVEGEVEPDGWCESFYVFTG